MGVKGLVISGEHGKIVIREKTDEHLELGELLISDSKDSKILLQVYDIGFGSQVSQQNLELISGMKLEESHDIKFMDAALRHYNLAIAKNIIHIRSSSVTVCKTLPSFFSEVRSITKDDFKFMTRPENALFLGSLRSGSKTLDVSVFLPGVDVLSHHILIPATTGRGKSNLTKVLLWDMVDKDFCASLVLDPHDEYYGRNSLGLKDHPLRDRVKYFTPFSPPPGERTLKINLKFLHPNHFNGVVDFSDPQRQAMHLYHKQYKDSWIEAIIKEKKIDSQFHVETLAVVRRRLIQLLDLDASRDEIICNGIFETIAGESTVNDICIELEKGSTVIIDTSSFSGSVELLIGSLITSEVFNRYKRYKALGQSDNKPVISVVLEEAPRVLGKDILEKGSNIFSTLAREGRKFKVGLVAITQLPSLIPREILANMNTKIILGIEMAPERQAIIESAAQDLSSDTRNIASLDKGEALITSNFARFATPVKIPLFESFAKDYQNKYVAKKYSKEDFGGIKIKG